MQDIEEAFIPHVDCPQKKEAHSVCCNKNCTQYPFICFTNKCTCFEKLHRHCTSVGWNSILERVNKKKQSSSQIFDSFSSQVQAIYDQVIEKLSRQKQKFLDWKIFIGLNEYERQLMRLIQDSREDEITGKLMNDVINNINSQQKVEACQGQLVKQYWQGHHQRLDMLMIQLKNLYIRPCRPFPKDLVQHEQKINKLFDKTPSKYLLIHEGAKCDFSMQEFHNQCNTVAKTLTVIMTTTGQLAGGYTPVAWQGNSHGKWCSDQTNSTFSFLQKQGGQLKKSASASSKSVFHYDLWGPTFGAGRDIVIFNHQKSKQAAQFNKVSGYQSRGCEVYSPEGSKETGKYIKNYWVFQVFWE